MVSLLACRQAACQAHREGRLREKSGRRDSNSRQPAWKAGTLPLSYSRRVGMRGFEPRTSCSQSRRATNCATPRLIHWDYITALELCQVLFSLADVLIQKETNVNVFSSLDSLG